MNIETIVRAMDIAHLKIIKDIITSGALEDQHKHSRQYHAFRVRILRMDKEKDEAYAKMEAEFEHYQDQFHE